MVLGVFCRKLVDLNEKDKGDRDIGIGQLRKQELVSNGQFPLE